MSDDKLTFKLTNSKVKILTQNRGRMKITIKLAKDEAEGYLGFKKTMLPEGANEDEFVKAVFFMGLEQFHKNALNMMNKYVEENEAKLKEDGIDTDAVKNLTKEMLKTSSETSNDSEKTE